MATTATWQSYLPQYEVQFNLPRGLLGALVRAESGGNPAARSPVGAIGLGQLMPATAQSLGVNPYDPIQNLRGAAMYLSQQLKAFGGDWRKALAAYNAGPGAVRQYGGVPPYAETRSYVNRVHDYWKQSNLYGKGQGAQGMLTAGPAPTRETVPGLDPGSVARLQYAYVDEPTIGNAVLQQRMDQQSKFDADYQSKAQSYASNSTPFVAGVKLPGKDGFFKTPNGWVRNRLDGEEGYQFLDRLFGRGFGLQHDPGNTQTTGGQHAANGYHQRHQASDFGTARNPWGLINQAVEWSRPRWDALGLAQLIWQSAGHYDHAHWATRT